ncbi:hypothetical protein BH10ACI1_BH10ACI1_20420 [soil metagenome]
MKSFNFSLYIVCYNFIIGVLLMLASEKVGVYAGHFTGSYREKISRLSRIVILTFGTCVAVLSGGIYLAFYVFKLHE